MSAGCTECSVGRSSKMRISFLHVDAQFRAWLLAPHLVRRPELLVLLILQAPVIWHAICSSEERVDLFRVAFWKKRKPSCRAILNYFDKC